MVTKLKDNISYIRYIRKQMSKSLPEWKEDNVAYEGQPNNNFVISYKKDLYEIKLVKDRGLLELNIYNNEEPIRISTTLYNSILDNIPDQNPSWRLSLCVELIDYYINYLKKIL